MLVKELIELLSKLDQEKEITHMIGYNGISEESIEKVYIPEDKVNNKYIYIID